MLLEMRLVGLAMDPFSNSPIVILKDRQSVEREDAKVTEAESALDGVEALDNLDTLDTLDTLDEALEEEQEAAGLVEEEASSETKAADEPADELADVVVDEVVDEVVSELLEGTSGTQPEEDKEGRILPIWIGEAEAHAIATVLLNLSPSRPMTHDLLHQAIQALGGSVHRVVVTDLRENTFYANIELILEDGEIMVLDARPSDAIALALRCDADIFVEDSVLDKTKQNEDTAKLEKEGFDELEEDKWKELVENYSNDSVKKYTQ